MEEHDIKKKAEIENAKVQLNHTQRLIAETMNRIAKAEAEYQEGKMQFSKRMTNIQSIQESQSYKLIKLNTDVQNLEPLVNSRKEEEAELKRVNDELENDLQKTREEIMKMDSEHTETLEGLEDEIKMGYLQIQNEKEVEVLLELALSSLKTEEQLPFMKEALFRIWEETQKRQNELKEQLQALEKTQRKMEKEIKVKQEELAQEKDKHTNLTQVYAVTKKQEKKWFS